MLLLAYEHDPVWHGHIELFLIVPGVCVAIVSVQNHVALVKVLAGSLDALRDSHLLADVLSIIRALKHRIFSVGIEI